ncbi:MAG TPA: hypothetical protein VHC00_13770 [Rhizobiaceae bacterium]|nr:hypothetical protein [Rhizobiaceae bacterium]
MVRNPDEEENQCRSPQTFEQRGRAFGQTLAAKREDTPMDVEAGDPVHDLLRSGIDRHALRRGRKDFGETGKAVFQHQNGSRLKASCGEKDVEHDLSLGDEKAFAADEIALPYVAISCDPVVQWIIDVADFTRHDRDPASIAPAAANS